ncbi:MAG: hypothetical protein IKK69_02450 [Firmicutes bacterium]|nr:hypothetical protein [Bacillota bacterium]
MKNTGVCPKCGGTEIKRIAGHKQSNGNWLSINYSHWDFVGVHRYLCCSCGFSEEWIDSDDIEKIKKEY